MTEIAKAPHEQVQRTKWQNQARRIAAELKGIPSFGDRTAIKVAIAFDDQVVTVDLPVELILRLNEAALAEVIFNGVLDSQTTDHRATGESAGAHEAPGMECGHAAPQAPDRNPETPVRPQSAHEDGAGQPAVPAVSERCLVNITGEQCANEAAGGLRLNMFPTLAVQKRYGKRVMLSLIMDLPICAACMPKVTPSNVMTEEQWRGFSLAAQQRNSGILADREQTEIVLCQFNEPEYVALRAHVAKQANKSQPAPAGPQQGAGDGS